MSRKLNPTYNDIHDACVSIVKQIKMYELKFDAIIGVSRGGLIPATIISQMLDTPLIPVSYSSKKGKGDDKNHTNILPALPDKTILIVDDICDSGNTLAELVNYYIVEDAIVSTAVIHYKRLSNPVIVPKFIWLTVEENDGWVNYPWEKK